MTVRDEWVSGDWVVGGGWCMIAPKMQEWSTLLYLSAAQQNPDAAGSGGKGGAVQ